MHDDTASKYTLIFGKYVFPFSFYPPLSLHRTHILDASFINKEIQTENQLKFSDPISPYHFLLCAEILGVLIRNNKDHKVL